jgi:uncharacterized protein YqjF (DUF2071 family)
VKAPWLLAMDWRDALFLHWRVAPDALRARLPRDVELDLHEGSAWVGLVAFRIERPRPRFVPAPLSFAGFGEINVRTYARVRGGKPGVWFFSLDAADPGAVEIARRAVHLPYYRARVTTRSDAGGAAYTGERTDRRAPAARFAANAGFAGAERYAASGTLEHFLVERYCFYTVDPRGRTVRGDVAHEPWPLRDAQASIGANTLLAAAGIEPLAAAPLVHASAGVHARAWALRPAR